MKKGGDQSGSRALRHEEMRSSEKDSLSFNAPGPSLEVSPLLLLQCTRAYSQAKYKLMGGLFQLRRMTM